MNSSIKVHDKKHLGCIFLEFANNLINHSTFEVVGTKNGIAFSKKYFSKILSDQLQFKGILSFKLKIQVSGQTF